MKLSPAKQAQRQRRLTYQRRHDLGCRGVRSLAERAVDTALPQEAAKAVWSAGELRFQAVVNVIAGEEATARGTQHVQRSGTMAMRRGQ